MFWPQKKEILISPNFLLSSLISSSITISEEGDNNKTAVWTDSAESNLISFTVSQYSPSVSIAFEKAPFFLEGQSKTIVYSIDLCFLLLDKNR